MNRVNKILFACVISFLPWVINSCQTSEKFETGYTISTELAGLVNGQAILAKLDLTTNEQVNIDTVTIEKGHFEFQGSIERPYVHTIFINDTSKIHLFLENSKIEIKGNINDIDKVKIVGSREDSLFHSYSMDAIFERESGMEIMLNHSDYTFAAFTAYYQFQVFNIELDTMTAIIENFSETVKQSDYYKHLAPLYETIKRVSISQPAPEFSMPDPDGNPIELNSFSGKYVLIDFWASWCAPCRAVNPDLVKIYDKYGNKGFTILGVSVDKDREKWLKAIEQDGLQWTNVSEANGWNEITDLYGIKAVPQNFLLDPQGIIIDKNIEVQQLDILLEEVLNQVNQ